MMRMSRSIAALTCLSLAGMFALGAARARSAEPAVNGLETVVATFHVVRGRESDFQNLLTREWEVYKAGNLVVDQPNVVVRGEEADGSTYFVHIFTWANRATPDHPPASVLAVWQSMEPLVEARNGHRAMEIAQVRLISPAD